MRKGGDRVFDKKVFASRLRGKRAELGWNQSELSDASGVSVATITSYENEGYIPGVDNLWKLCEALGCTPNDLCGWDAA